MSLTTGHGPLARASAPSNFTLDGPAHKILFSPFPRRVRAFVGEQQVLDTDRAVLLHETGLLPQVYVPLEDVRADVLGRTDHRTHCPFKGDASYFTVAGSENALWAYEDPLPEAAWLRGYAGAYFDRFDRWLDEDDEVHTHLRDPFHRVDARPASRAVRVTAGDEVLAASRRAFVVSETGLPNRLYVPREDVRVELRASATRTGCPYKGIASYWSAGDREDVAWSYEAPLEAMARAAGHVSFDGDGVRSELVG
ncbi:MAG: DUF427 domain-containing protein [Solirubrobacterales bacterium]|nr:DUF427 domain-containing protein [Solirubrobacterales bacterium]